MPYANPEDAKAYDKAYYEKNKERFRVKSKAYREKNKEKISVKKKAYREKNRDKIRASELKRNFGITLHEYSLMFTEQKGKCACCGIHQNELTRNLAVDHDHDTGLIRGLLCSNCNTSIGKLGDNIEGLMKALNYLEKHELTKERKTNEHVVQVKPKPNVQVKVQRGHLQPQVPA
jgi:CO dehydrogenase nickel-insertion accessory protein CooC1